MTATRSSTRTARALLYAVTVTPMALTGLVVLGILGRALGSDRVWWWLCRAWARGFVRSCGIKIVDREIVERELHRLLTGSRPVVVAASHLSYADTLIFMALSRVPLRFVAKRALLWVPLLGWAMLATGQISIARHRPGAASATLARTGIRLRRRPGIVVCYPEGTRSRTGELGSLKPGAFRLSCSAGALVLPLAHWGARSIWPRTFGRISAGSVAVALGSHIDPEAACAVVLDDRALIDHLRNVTVEQLGRLVRTAKESLETAAHGAP